MVSFEKKKYVLARSENRESGPIAFQVSILPKSSNPRKISHTFSSNTINL